MLESRLEGLRATLAATEQHAAALEEELAARPTQTQVGAARGRVDWVQSYPGSVAVPGFWCRVSGRPELMWWVLVQPGQGGKAQAAVGGALPSSPALSCGPTPPPFNRVASLDLPPKPHAHLSTHGPPNASVVDQHHVSDQLRIPTCYIDVSPHSRCCLPANPHPTCHMQLEELRAQLRVLQAIGYNSLDLEPDSDTPAAAAAPSSGTVGGAKGGGGGAPGSAGSLEALLLSKNRHLEHELTMMKLRVVDVRQEADAALAQAAELEGQLAEQVGLTAERQSSRGTENYSALGCGRGAELEGQLAEQAGAGSKGAAAK